MWGTSVTVRKFSVPMVAGTDVRGSAVAVDATSGTCRNAGVASSVVRVSGVTSVACADTWSSALPIGAPTFAHRNTCCVTTMRGHAVSHTAGADIRRRTVSVDARRVASW